MLGGEMLHPKKNEHYTYADYCTWDDECRWELINGAAYAMCPAPSYEHQQISVKLTVLLGTFLNGKPYKLFHAPFDVRLNADDEDDTVVQPDLVVICDRSKINKNGCRGVPDFIIEILSPSTARHDRWLKYNLYKNAGVREFWIVDPDTKTVSVNVLKDGDYIGKAYGDTDTAPVSVLPGCEINLTGVFAD
jgi:Uma2 family endonuclease